MSPTTPATWVASQPYNLATTQAEGTDQIDPADQKKFETTDGDVAKNEERGEVKDEVKDVVTDEDKVKDKDQAGEPVEVTGAGPKPLAAVAKEHGGDAAGVAETKTETTSADAEATDDKGEEEKSKGTGEEYVKTTGLAADGGNFDATKPGAGREADRKSHGK